MTDKTSEFPKMGHDNIHGMSNVSASGMEPHRYRPRQPVQPTPTTAHNRAPVPVVPEKQSTAYERKLAERAPGVRCGPTRFEEGLGADPTVPSNFVGGILGGYLSDVGEKGKLFIQKTYADGRGAAGRTSPPPTWDQVRGSELGAFAQGTGYSRALDAEQAVNQAPLRVGVDTSKLDLRERVSNQYDRAIAVNDDRFRPNAASGYRAGEPR